MTMNDEELARGRAKGRRAMVESGHLARIAAKGRETMRRTRTRESYQAAGRAGATKRWGKAAR